MSVKLDKIQFMQDETVFETTYRARILIQTQRKVTRLEQQLWPIGKKEEHEKALKDQLAAAILHHIYGDLVVPINELAILAQHHITGVNDQGEISGLREGLRKLLQGI